MASSRDPSDLAVVSVIFFILVLVPREVSVCGGDSRSLPRQTQATQRTLLQCLAGPKNRLTTSKFVDFDIVASICRIQRSKRADGTSPNDDDFLFFRHCQI